MTTTEKTYTERLKETEDKLFTRRDETEGAINKVARRELTPLEFLQIRQAIGEFEECERRIEKVQEQMESARKWDKE
jgi:prefoldin subunit 5